MHSKKAGLFSQLSLSFFRSWHPAYFLLGNLVLEYDHVIFFQFFVDTVHTSSVHPSVCPRDNHNGIIIF